MLSRELAHKNHYPAVDVLQSVSRVMKEVTSKDHVSAAGKIRTLLAAYKKNEDLINIGAYVSGADPVTDQAIRFMPMINQFLQQKTDEKTEYENTIDALMQLGSQISL